MRRFRESIKDFILDNIKARWENHENSDRKQFRNKYPKHLLNLLRTNILQYDEKYTKSCSIVQQYLVEIMTGPLEKIMDLIECIGKALENFPRRQTAYLQFCRNAEELKAAGIRLKPKNIGCVIDIDFNLGTLKIHPIRVDNTTISIFLNLIAYEMTPDFPNNFDISSYIAFLDSLIDRAQDVKELRDEQILLNFVGSDEEVAKLFNEVGTNLVPNPMKYFDVKKNIQKCYKNKCMTRIAQLSHQHFQSPWRVIAFLAAAAILTFTTIQTVYTMKGHYE